MLFVSLFETFELNLPLYKLKCLLLVCKKNREESVEAIEEKLTTLLEEDLKISSLWCQVSKGKLTKALKKSACHPARLKLLFS